MKLTKVLLPLFFCFFSFLKVFGQAGQIEIIEGAGFMASGEKNGEKYIRLLQNVHLRQKETDLYCDSAHFYRATNIVQVFSNVRVTQGTLVITSATGVYNGNLRTATFAGGVNLRDDKMTMTTPSMSYDMNTRIARYTEGGNIVEPPNTITSKFGTYEANTKMISFRGTVHVVSPDADIQSDTIQYNTTSKVVFFVAQTRIQNLQATQFAKGGTYNTLTKAAAFRDAQVDTEDYTIAARQASYGEDKAGRYAFYNGGVKMTSKDQKNKTIITGQVAQYWHGTGRSKVSGSPVMRSLVSGDTLYISADTLMATNNKDPQKKDFVYAYYDVRMFKSDLQGKCDSLTYNLTDSVLFMNHNPIIWSNNSQLVADTMQMLLKNRTIDRMYLYNNAFIISEDTLKNLNQIKGRDMTAFFQKGDIRRVDVNGNGESIYFALEGDTILTGMNKTVCSDMVLKFDIRKLKTISFLTNPDASFVPPHELNEPDRRLKGFKWRIDEKPDKTFVMSKRTKKPAKPAPSATVPALAKREEPNKITKPSRRERKKN